MERSGPIHLVLEQAYQFNVEFGLVDVPALVTDATPPLGQARGPDSEMLLVASVANCLCASLAFALRKFKNDSVSMSATASAQLTRNEQGRQRVQSIQVDIRLEAPASALRLWERALAQYEDFCVVTQSVRAAIPISVRVRDREDVLLAVSD